MAYIDTKYLFECETCRRNRTGMCDTWCESGECYQPDMSKIPTADVEEVVRCKNCKHEHTDPFCQMWCRLHRKHEGERLVEENHFCSYGERKDGKDINDPTK